MTLPFTIKPKLTDFFNANMKVANSTPSTIGFSPVTRTLPVSGETYESPVIAQPTKPQIGATPQVQTPPQPTQPATGAGGIDYSKYTDPVTGKIMSPTEYADFLAKRVNGGSIPNYAGDSLTQGPQTSAQIASTATDLNNQRNDIAVGESDPYSIASKSGIAYSPNEMAAIEKAYAGIYDPALKDVFAKLDKKQKDDEAANTLKIDLAKMAKQHQYDIELKKTAPGAAASTVTAGTYAPGQNPTVDAWAERIFNGSAKITDIPASDKGMRNAVTVALQSYGNQANGKPTTTEIGLQTLDAAKRLKKMFDSGEGTSTVGKSRLFGGGIATPGSDSANFVNLFNTLIANRSLEGVKFLKGQGQVSDAERLLLKNAMSELNLSQGEDAFSSSLQSIIDKLEGNSPTEETSTAGAVLKSPDGTQEVSVADLTPSELEEAKANGWQ